MISIVMKIGECVLFFTMVMMLPIVLMKRSMIQ